MQFPDFGNFPKYDDIWSTPGTKAAIDIGTNTVLLLVARVENDEVVPLFELQRLPRLGKGVGANRVLSLDRMEAVIMILHEYRTVIEEKFGEIPVIVTATSAVRDAQNKMEFMWMAEEATGYRIRLLSGSEEAVCTFKGAASQIETPLSDILSVDIGGGSTEISRISGNEISGVSYNVGSVRLSEKLGSQLQAVSLTELRTQVSEYFRAEPAQGLAVDWSIIALNKTLVGVAGTATTIAALYSNLTKYHSKSVNGCFVPLSYVDELIAKMWVLPPHEILKMNPLLLEGREDLILSGCVIMSELIKLVKKEGFLTSTGGIRHGTLLTPLYR